MSDLDIDLAVSRAQIKAIKPRPAIDKIETEDGLAYFYSDGKLRGVMNADAFRKLWETTVPLTL